MHSNTPRLNPDFNHRLTLGAFPENNLRACSLDLNNTVDIMGLRATGVLKMLSEQFHGEDRNKYSDIDEAIFWTLHTVIQEINDMTQAVTAFHNYLCETEQAQKKPEL